MTHSTPDPDQEPITTEELEEARDYFASQSMPEAAETLQVLIEEREASDE